MSDPCQCSPPIPQAPTRIFGGLSVGTPPPGPPKKELKRQIYMLEYGSKFLHNILSGKITNSRNTIEAEVHDAYRKAPIKKTSPCHSAILHQANKNTEQVSLIMLAGGRTTSHNQNQSCHRTVQNYN